MEHRHNHFPRFWRPIGVALSAFFLLSVSSIFAARLPDEEVCIRFTDYSSQSIRNSIFDSNTGHYAPDPRGGTLYWSWTSPDGQRTAFLERDTDEGIYFSLYIQQNDGRWSEGDKGLLVQDDIQMGSDFNYQNTLAWSHDSQRLAYIWRSANYDLHLSIVDVTSGEKQTTLYEPISNRLNVAVSGWSGDDAYVATVKRADLGQQYLIWSTETLQQVAPDISERVLLNGSWAQTGRQFAAITLDRDTPPQLMLYTPGQAPIFRDISVDDTTITTVIWSPDGRYAVVASADKVCYDNCNRYWHYDIFDREGRQLYAELHGGRLPIWDINNNNIPTSTNSETIVSGMWTPDSQAWIFLQERGGENGAVTDLVKLGIADGKFATLGSDIVQPYGHYIFFVPPEQRIFNTLYVPSPIYKPEGKHVLIPYWQDGKVRVELADLQSGQRISMVEVADQLYTPQSDYYWGRSIMFWNTWNDPVAISAFATVSGESRQEQVAVANLASMRVTTSDPGTEKLSGLRWITEDWIAFLGEREGVSGVEIFNVATGEQKRILEGVGAEQRWNVMLSPNQQQVAVLMYEENQSNWGDLYLWDGDHTRLIDTEVVTSYPFWTADGEKMAYLQGKASKDRTIKVVNADGSVTRNWVMGRTLNSNLYGQYWSSCY